MHMMTCQILVLGQNTRGVTYCKCGVRVYNTYIEGLREYHRTYERGR